MASVKVTLASPELFSLISLHNSTLESWGCWIASAKEMSASGTRIPLLEQDCSAQGWLHGMEWGLFLHRQARLIVYYIIKGETWKKEMELSFILPSYFYFIEWASRAKQTNKQNPNYLFF